MTFIILSASVSAAWCSRPLSSAMTCFEGNGWMGTLPEQTRLRPHVSYTGLWWMVDNYSRTSWPSNKSMIFVTTNNSATNGQLASWCGKKHINIHSHDFTSTNIGQQHIIPLLKWQKNQTCQVYTWQLESFLEPPKSSRNETSFVVFIPIPSKGCQLNPKGWWIDTP